jgi:hypothetical protein
VVLSFLFINAIHALSVGTSLYSLGTIKLFLRENYMFIVLFTFTALFVGKFKKYSQWILLFYTVVVVFKSFIFLASGFNKLVLGLDFIYLLFAFYFFTSWELYVLKAAHNPNYSSIDLEKQSRFNISGYMADKNDNKIESFLLTNIDEESCFVILDGLLPTKTEKQVKVVIDYENVRFESIAEPVSSYGNGLGFIYKNDKQNLRSLSGLYKICRQRGLV